MRRGRPPHDDCLTPAEWRVVEAVRHGLSNRQIAQRRGVSLDAVKYHVGNALSKLGFSGRKGLRRWNGIARSTALAAKELVMPESITLGPLAQISRKVKDIAAARIWYGETLGLRHLYSFGDLAFYDCGGLRLFLSQDRNAGKDESILYFRVPDIRSAHTLLQQRGIEFTSAPHMIHRHDNGTEEWLAVFNDNEGRPLAIMAQVQAAA